jgi:hypothetical protein
MRRRRLHNILVDGSGNMQLYDFGSTLPVGNPLLTGTKPFARLISKEEGKGAGTYGHTWSYTEKPCSRVTASHRVWALPVRAPRLQNADSDG